MKLVRQTHLSYKKGTSDKVYEVDLCEVSGDQCVVNFRYGRRGTTLREGTKTVFPVPFATAEKIFHDLVQSKVKKGYKASRSQSTSKTVFESAVPQIYEARKESVLHHLELAAQHQERKGNWRLSRVIWRAGELKLAEAVPYLLELAGESADMFRYSLAWALGRCADRETADEVVKTLLHYYHDPSNTDAIQRISAEGIGRIHQYVPQDAFFHTLVQSLPTGLQESARHDESGQLEQKIHEYLFELQITSNDYLTTLYHLSWKYPHIRSALLKILKTLPVEPNYFHWLRYIFKAAEFREDCEVYGLLASRFEKIPERYRRQWYDGYKHVQIKGKWQVRKREKPTIAPYSDRTRAYFRRRILRTLQRAGEAGDKAYPEMAAEILLRFDDRSDKTEPYTDTFYRYEFKPFRSIEHSTHYDSYAPYLIFNFILYANSSRYEYTKGAHAWKCVASYQPGQPAPETREEAFPELWTNAPHSLLKLLTGSFCLRVHEFAVKAFKDVPDYGTYVENDRLISMLALPYQMTNELALDIAKQQYSADDPEKNLVLALLNCSYDAARETAREWIEDLLAIFLQDSIVVCELILNPYADIRQWARELLPTYDFSDIQEQAVISRVIAALLVLEPDQRSEEDLKEIVEMLLFNFPQKMYRLGLEVIRDLLRHPSPVLQRFAGSILLKHEIDTKDLPDDLFVVLLEAANPEIRALGVQLVGKLPDELLLSKEQLLTSFCIVESPEIRTAVKPIVGRLAAANRDFGTRLVEQLYTVFLFQEAYEGVHQDLCHLCIHELSGSLDVLDQRKVWKLLHSSYQGANQLGAYLLKNTLNIEDFALQQLVELAKSALLELRELVWNFYRDHPDRIKQEKGHALGIVDSDWEDSRQFAFKYFRNRFDEDDWTPELLIGLCDSVREDVQAFGREMITRFFDEAHGSEYLLKLSQHPSVRLQQFATNYLERFAAGNSERIEGLTPYFITLLSQVNKGRVAKARVFKFLQTEAMKSEAAARVTAQVLTRQSVTMAIGDKAACIATLRDIQKTYPGIETPVRIQQVPIYVKKAYRPKKKEEHVPEQKEKSVQSLLGEVKERLSAFWRQL
ncbi:hypothetical protein CSA56_17280 [candidate division KSB3 bacterium]|uniref:WGR domain-containing protein n=1 Tax=candidate division KSB3 bacterium TaxID=2044937 RepID=A0A2G6K7V6_9BACT|nr:MAG: hypothetical protein CSA56_17280 [candidate division KSB3 bacterium]